MESGLRVHHQESFPSPQMIASVWQCTDHRRTGNSLCWDEQADHLCILTTNLAAVVCVDVCQCATFDQFLPSRSYFESKRPENFVRIAKFLYAAFGPLFAFHCPLFVTRNNDLECKSSRFAAVVRRSRSPLCGR